MADEKIIVKNFGPIRDVELDLCKVTVLIGEQASGKSVLAKLIAKFEDYNEIRPGFNAFDYYNLDSCIENGSEVIYDNNLYQIEYKYTNGEPDKIKKKFKNHIFQNEIDELQKAQENFFLSEHKYDKATNESDRDELRLQKEFWGNKLDSQFKKLSKIISEIIYIPTERLLVSILSESDEIRKSIAPKFQFVYKFYSEYWAYRKSNDPLHIDFLNLKFQHHNYQDEIELKNNKIINLSDSSNGIQSIIPMLVVLNGKAKSRNKKVFIIEEPELNLYPTTQKKLVEYLIEKCTKGDNRLIITTHSPYILTALNNLIQAKNVAKNRPELADEVGQIVPPQYHLDFEDIAAYFVADGMARSIMNVENQLIDANALDDVSNDLSEEFGKLVQLEFQDLAI